jgi:thioredoxin reductase
MPTSETDSETAEVLIVGGGAAVLTAATCTARAGLDTTVVDTDGSIHARNAHLENVPGFPGGINARRFLDLLAEQAEESGARLETGRVTDIERLDSATDVERSDSATATDVERSGKDGDAFEVSARGGDDETRIFRTDAVVAASWSDASYLDGLDVETRDAGSKTYVVVDDLGRTDVDGVYAAGRLTEKYHQAVVAAGHGAEVGLTVVHDSETPYYHDWVTPEGYSTDRGREVPPGCE